MQRIALLLAVLASGCVIHTNDDDDDDDDDRPGTTSDTLFDGTDPINHALDALVEAGPPGALAVRGEGDELRWGRAGLADLDRDEAPELYQRFRIASVTKSFVATVVLQLVDEKKLDLDARVSTYAPDLLPESMPVTVRQLLQHTSGLADYHDFDGLDTAADFVRRRYENPSARDRIDLALAHSPVSAPGAEFHYTDTNYRVLELLVADVTHRSLAAEIDARIISKLHLAQTTFPDDDAQIDGPHLHGYIASDSPEEPFGDQRALIDYTIQTLDQTGAAGAMISSAPDLSRFFTALLDGELLSDAMLAEMQTTVPVDEGSAALGMTGYGLGLERWDLGCGEVWGHGGSTRGYTTLAFAKRGILVATQDPLPLAAYEPALGAAALLVCPDE